MVRRLVLVQHLLLVVLVVVGVARALATGTAPLPLLLASAALLLWYAVGARAASVRLREPGPRSSGRTDGGLRAGGWWLLGLVACWLVATAVSPDLVWVAFSVWLLAGHLLPLRGAVVLGLLVLVVVVARGGHAEGWSTAAVVGPSVGALFALALSRGLQALVRDNAERRRLIASLVAAQEEAEELHAELAQAQREAGVLAERTRLSRDIHDTLAQGFSSILLLARAGTATDDPVGQRRLLDQIGASAADHLDEARRVVGALAPAPLESGLTDAVRRIAGRFEDETGVEAQVRVDGDVGGLPPPLEVTLLRTAQTALANVRQHASAHRVVLTLAEAGESVRLDVVDDGRGFVPGEETGARRETPSRGGYGLRAARERLRELGGDLEVESGPGRGTAVSAHVPRGTGRAPRRSW